MVYTDKIYDLSKINNFIGFLENMNLKDTMSYIFAEHVFQILISNEHRHTNTTTNINNNYVDSSINPYDDEVLMETHDEDTNTLIIKK